MRPTVLNPSDPATLAQARGTPRAAGVQAQLEARQRQGKLLVVAGWIVAVVGVVLYCVASFSGESDADLAAVLFHGAVPAARAALLVVACGTVLWIAGSVVHTRATLDAADLEAARRRSGSTSGR